MVARMADDGTSGDDYLNELGRELREAIGAEMRLEAETSERDAAAVEMRRRLLADVARELASRGDTVTLFAGARSVRGTVTYARGDIATLDTPGGQVDAHLAAGLVLRVDARSPSGGTASRSGSDTLRARLLEHELARNRLEFWSARHGLEISGDVIAVGKDHAIVRDRDDQEWTIPLMDVAWVRRVPNGH